MAIVNFLIKKNIKFGSVQLNFLQSRKLGAAVRGVRPRVERHSRLACEL